MHAYTLAPEHPFCFAQEQFNQIVDLLSSPDALVMEHGDIEAMLKVEGFELLRRLMQDHLDLRTVRESKREVIGGRGDCAHADPCDPSATGDAVWDSHLGPACPSGKRSN